MKTLMTSVTVALSLLAVPVYAYEDTPKHPDKEHEEAFYDLDHPHHEAWHGTGQPIVITPSTGSGGYPNMNDLVRQLAK